MSAVLNVALPVFAIIAAGFACGRFRILGQDASEALNKFVYWVALPPLLFFSMARAPIQEVLHLPFIGAFLGGVLVVWALGMVDGWLGGAESGGELTMRGMSATFSNTGYMGIPLFVAAFGAEAGLPPASLATVIMSAVCVGLAVVGLEVTGAERRPLATVLRDVALALVKNPLVVSPVLGLAWSATGLAVPLPFANLFQLLGAAAGPSALFAIGLFLASRPLVADLGRVGWICTLKLLVQPLVTGLLAITVFPMEPFWQASAILLAALPTGALTFVVAQKYGVYVERASTVILLSTVLSVFTLSGLLAIYGPRFSPV